MRSPKPSQIRSAREKAGLSRDSAAKLIYKSVRTWEKWETGERTMDPAFWELWKLKAQGGMDQLIVAAKTSRMDGGKALDEWFSATAVERHAPRLEPHEFVLDEKWTSDQPPYCSECGFTDTHPLHSRFVERRGPWWCDYCGVTHEDGETCARASEGQTPD